VNADRMTALHVEIVSKGKGAEKGPLARDLEQIVWRPLFREILPEIGHANHHGASRIEGQVLEPPFGSSWNLPEILR
jgi:hypothetical protein